MRFLRQFAAAAAVVAVVVLAGLAWSRLAPSLPGEGPAGRVLVIRGGPPGMRLPPGAKRPRPGSHPVVRINDGSGTPNLLLGDLLEPVNLVVLRNTALLEAVVIAGVVLLDMGYRRLRRARRSRRPAAAPANDI